MSQPSERVVVLDLGADAPPPSAALRARVHGAAAVTPRRQLRAIAQLLFGWGVLGGLVIVLIGLRPDLVALPTARFAGLSLAWSCLLLIAVAGALLPARGQVLPSLSRARALAGLVPLSGLLLAVELIVEAPGRTIHPDAARAPAAIAHCLGLALAVLIPALAVTWVTLRRLAPVGARFLGAALGAGAGTLGALVLHFICPVGGTLHLGAAHAGGIALGALLGAGLGALLDAREPA